MDTFLLKEDGDFLLLEDDFKIILEGAVLGPVLAIIIIAFDFNITRAVTFDMEVG